MWPAISSDLLHLAIRMPQFSLHFLRSEMRNAHILPRLERKRIYLTLYIHLHFFSVRSEMPNTHIFPVSNENKYGWRTALSFVLLYPRTWSFADLLYLLTCYTRWSVQSDDLLYLRTWLYMLTLFFLMTWFICWPVLSAGRLYRLTCSICWPPLFADLLYLLFYSICWPTLSGDLLCLLYLLSSYIRWPDLFADLLFLITCSICWRALSDDLLYSLTCSIGCPALFSVLL